jgi:hypothetical protein
MYAVGIEFNTRACCQRGEILVHSPKTRVVREEHGRQQGYIGGAAPGVIASLVFDQRKYLIGCSDDGLLESFEISERSIAGRRRSAAGKFDDYKRMAQYLIHRDQPLERWIRDSEMCNPD